MSIEQTLILSAVTEADQKLIKDVELMLLRQTGAPHVFRVYKDDKGKLWAAASWEMTRSDRAVVTMMLRRGTKPKDDAGKPTKALLAKQDVEAKPLEEVKIEKKLTLQTAATKP